MTLHKSNRLLRAHLTPLTWLSCFSFPLFRGALGKRLCKEPLMLLRIFGAIPSSAIKRILWFFDDFRPGLLRSLKVTVDILDIDVLHHRHPLLKPVRVLIFGAGTSHHDDIVSQFHSCVQQLAVFPAMGIAVFLETKRLR